MTFLQLVFCSLTIYSASEGKIVLGIIGQNISISWAFSIKKTDAIHILHNGIRIHEFFPNNKYSVPRKPPYRGSFTIDYSTPEKVTVTINFLDITENDTGVYRVVRQLNLEDLDDSVDLQATEINYYTAAWIRREEDKEGINNYTTAGLSQKIYTEGISHYTATAVILEVDAEAFPSKHHLLYIVLGMGVILAVAFIACLQQKIRISLRTDRVSNANAFSDSNKDGQENIQDYNVSGNYWTIVSNQSGELSTAIEMIPERHSKPQLIAQTIVQSKEILRRSNITRKEELDGYLNPVRSCPMEFDDYIHPVNSDPLNAISASVQYIEIL